MAGCGRDNQVFMPLGYFYLLILLGLLFSVSICILRENIEYLDFKIQVYIHFYIDKMENLKME